MPGRDILTEAGDHIGKSMLTDAADHVGKSMRTDTADHGRKSLLTDVADNLRELLLTEMRGVVGRKKQEGRMKLNEPFLDIIAIGAINYDCIFFCDRVHRISETASGADVGEVEEKFSYTREDICRQIDLLLTEAEHRISVGGSSFNSLRTAREIDKKIQLGFVGVCGKPAETEIRLGFDPDPTTTFTFLDNQDWLFFDEEPPGLSCVQVMKADGNRGDIAIVPGANNLLKERIQQREQEKGEGSFARYLSRSKWIHISSLADFDAFLFIVEHLKAAKQMNPLLQISFDPGYLYTREYKPQLREMIDLTDFLFLSQSEFDNLTEKSAHPGWKDRELIEELYRYSGENPKRVIVIKDKANNVLYRYRNKRVKRLKFRHEQLSDSRILNDTGAGDAFAGGFICGNISERMQLHHPVPMELGARAAIARMEELGDPYGNIHSVTNHFLKEFENYEYFDDMLKKTGEMPDQLADTRDKRTFNLTGIYLLGDEADERYALLLQLLSETGLNIVSLGKIGTPAGLEEDADDEEGLIDAMEENTHRFAVIVMPGTDPSALSAEDVFKIGYMSSRVGKDGILVLKSPQSEIPELLQGFSCIDIGDGDWKAQLTEELRQLGYRIA